MSSFLAGFKAKVIIPSLIGIFSFLGLPYGVQKLEVHIPEKNISQIISTTTEKVSENRAKITSTTVKTVLTTPKIKKILPTTTLPIKVEKYDQVLALKKELLQKIIKNDVLNMEEVNQKVRNSIINIFCTTKTGGDFKPISGSGVVISQDGLILTNAHVAQYFLLRNYNQKDFLACVGRTGSPAIPTYQIEPVYIPEKWLKDNAKKINEENPSGTGQNDYAFLAITNKIVNGQSTTTGIIPYLEIEKEDVFITGTPVVLSAYPAGFLGGIILQSSLWLTSSAGNIGKLYYLDNPEKTELFGLSGNILSQHGASGGAVVSLISGKLLGVIVTATAEKTTGEREIGAITLPYIISEFKKDSGNSIESFIKKSKVDLVSDFNNIYRENLEKIIFDVLNN